MLKVFLEALIVSAILAVVLIILQAPLHTVLIVGIGFFVVRIVVGLIRQRGKLRRMPQPETRN